MARPYFPFELDLRKPLATGVPIDVRRNVPLSGDGQAIFRFILEHDDDRLSLRQPFPKFGVFDRKGQQLLNLTYDPSNTNDWRIENPQYGRISFLLDGSHPGFGVIQSVHPQRLEWRLIGRFNSGLRRDLTAAKGDLIYTKSQSGTSTGGGTGDIDDALELELQWTEDHPLYYTEYQWNPESLGPIVGGTLNQKDHWDSPAKNTHLFTVLYDWRSTDGLLNRKRILRHRDNQWLVLLYYWDPDENLSHIVRTDDPAALP